MIAVIDLTIQNRHHADAALASPTVCQHVTACGLQARQDTLIIAYTQGLAAACQHHIKGLIAQLHGWRRKKFEVNSLGRPASTTCFIEQCIKQCLRTAHIKQLVWRTRVQQRCHINRPCRFFICVQGQVIS